MAMKPRMPGNLQQAAIDVSYEVRMLIEAASVIGGPWGSPMTTPEDSHKNMALDSFLLHYRNLRAFLCPSLQGVRPRADDVVGSDYLGNAESANVADAQKLADDKDRLDQMLAHLSYKRRKEYIATGKT